MGRIAIFAYGVVSYAIFFATFLYAIGFVGNIGVPTIARRPGDRVALWLGAGHQRRLARRSSPCSTASWRARRSSSGWTRTVPPAAERSTYVLFSSLALIAAVLAMAADGRRRVGRSRTPVLRGAARRRSALRLAARARHDIPHQPLRSLRTASGLAAPARPPVHAAGVPDSRACTATSAIRCTSAGCSPSGRRRP